MKALKLFVVRSISPNLRVDHCSSTSGSTPIIGRGCLRIPIPSDIRDVLPTVLASPLTASENSFPELDLSG